MDHCCKWVLEKDTNTCRIKKKHYFVISMYFYAGLRSRSEQLSVSRLITCRRFEKVAETRREAGKWTVTSTVWITVMACCQMVSTWWIWVRSKKFTNSSLSFDFDEMYPVDFLMICLWGFWILASGLLVVCPVQDQVGSGISVSQIPLIPGMHLIGLCWQARPVW